jgi:hypothetical protein
MIKSFSPLNDSHLKDKKGITKEKIFKEENIVLIKSKTNKKNFNLISKGKTKKNSQKIKKFEKRHTFRFLNNNIRFYDKLQKNFLNIKREKSADHLKKKSNSLREKIKNYFSEIKCYETNYNHNNNNNHKNGKNPNKNYNTLILFKKSKDDLLVEQKRKSYFSPERFEQKKKINFYKKLLNLRTVSGNKNNNNDLFLYNNYKENFNNNLNLNNYETNYASLIKSNFNIKSKNKNKKITNNKAKKEKKKNNRYDNILFFPQNNINNIGLLKIKSNIRVNPLTKSTNVSGSILSKLNKNQINHQNIKYKSSGEDKSPSLERITVNKNEENNNMKNSNHINTNNNISPQNDNNSYKINVRKIDSMTNYTNGINVKINLNKIEIEDNKIRKSNEVCFTDENEFINQNEKLEINKKNNSPIINQNNSNLKINNDDILIINDTERSFSKERNINNIRVCKNPEFQTRKKRKGKSQKRKQILKKRSGTEDPFSNNISSNIIKRERSKNKTPNKESIFSLRHFQKYLIINNNIKTNICGSSNNNNSSFNYLYNILPGNNGKLVEKVLKTRENWIAVESTQSQFANLIWTPLSCQINFSQHSISEITQYVNHFEFHSELTNKANTFINLFRYCEFNDIDLFNFYPLTIILSSNQDYLQTQIEGFKRCYQDIPSFINIDKEKNFCNDTSNNIVNKYYINYFFVNLSKKIGSLQKMKIPKTHYIGKNLWVLKRTNLNRGRQMKVLSNIEEIIKEINLMFEEKKPNNLIIQKYIEDPLLYNGRKFDIRIWVLFTYVGKDNKYEIYVFKEGHLKACSDNFNIDSDNLFIHLTNYSVQKHNKNFSKVEIGNEISFQLFQQELNRQNSGKNFKKDIFPEIIKIIGISAKAVKNKINIMNRKNCFEIFGYDFILDSNYQPFLLEINTNPGLEESSPLIKMLVPRMIDDALRLTIDKVFESNEGNTQKKNRSKFHVDGYKDEENMWLRIKVKKI